VIVYRSISGFTKKYAEWIAQELQADLFDQKTFNPKKLADYAVVVFGGSLHTVGINGSNLIKDNLPLLQSKQLVVFAVGASPPHEGIVEEIVTRNFPNPPLNFKLFYLRGGFNYGKLDRQNKLLMSLMKAKLKTKKEKTTDEEGMLAAYDAPLDCTKKENVAEIVAYVKGILN
jgi:menaquinone-dependent protoporphyrinogen IX oxidase